MGGEAALPASTACGVGVGRLRICLVNGLNILPPVCRFLSCLLPVRPLMDTVLSHPIFHPLASQHSYGGSGVVGWLLGWGPTEDAGWNPTRGSEEGKCTKVGSCAPGLSQKKAQYPCTTSCFSPSLLGLAQLRGLSSGHRHLHSDRSGPLQRWGGNRGQSRMCAQFQQGLLQAHHSVVMGKRHCSTAVPRVLG